MEKHPAQMFWSLSCWRFHGMTKNGEGGAFRRRKTCLYTELDPAIETAQDDKYTQ